MQKHIDNKERKFNMAQYITINLKKDVIVMKLSEKATQADTIKSLKKKLP